jgi:phosphomannomutase
LIALVLALQAISEDGRPLSQIVNDFKLYHRGDELNVEVESIEAKLEKLRYHFRDNIKDEIDGITVEFADWWFNVRASNTEPLLRITVETKNQESTEQHQKEILAVINN